MSHHIRITTISTLAMLLALGTAACSDSGEPTAATGFDSATAVFSNGGEMGDLSVQARKDLAALSQVVAPFHRIEAAMEAGWVAQITPCLEIGIGGMGYHYANPALLEDGKVSPTEPEALLYEPQKNGRLRFVGVEYIMPLGDSEDAPVLFGQEFHRIEEIGIWALHVWIARHNPTGIFADWNPNVTCEHA